MIPPNLPLVKGEEQKPPLFIKGGCQKIGKLRKQMVIRKDGRVEEDFERNFS
jgi:hypothetical protein